MDSKGMRFRAAHQAAILTGLPTFSTLWQRFNRGCLASFDHGRRGGGKHVVAYQRRAATPQTIFNAPHSGITDILTDAWHVPPLGA